MRSGAFLYVLVRSLLLPLQSGSLELAETDAEYVPGREGESQENPKGFQKFTPATPKQTPKPTQHAPNF